MNETEQIFILNPSENEPSSTTQKIVIEISTATQVNLENVEDFSNVCRTCATITTFVIPIFEGEGLQNNLAEKIHKHLPIQVTREDELPLAVCYQCLHTLLAWHELVACCRHADDALRARARLLRREQETQTVSQTVDEEGQSLENNEHKEFAEITNYVVLPMDPPQYEEPPTPTAPSLRGCGYCSIELPEKTYREHLIANHSELLFHCDDCDTYVDRKDFILHMSLHAVQIANNDKVPAKTEKKTDINENVSADSDKAECSNTEVENQTQEAVENTLNVNNNENNEFSDHSDTEFGFGLPESVFEAIEDSQDSQPAESVETQPVEDCGAPNEPLKPPQNELEKKRKKTRTCPICSKLFTASSSYFYHMKHFHKRSKEHECNVCGRKFGTKNSLTQHSFLHSGETRYECKECGKRFRSKASKYIHEQTHTGVKKYSCGQCAVAFRWRTHLARHVQRHAAARSHVCGTCGRGFSIRCDLLRHARTHDAQQFACDKCGTKFAQLRYLKVHMDRKHAAIAADRGQGAPRVS